MRLLFFDLFYGNRIGGKYIINRLGFKEGVFLIAKLKLRLALNNPFDKINEHKKPSENQQLSQQQMAPVVVLYELLKEQGYSQEEAINFLSGLGKEVAVAFLKYNVPIIHKTDWANRSLKEKNEKLTAIVKRFFNVEADATVEEGDRFVMDVTFCHFASYVKQLGVPELGPIFCAADGCFFEEHQPDIDFKRSQTLAIDGKPCDFRFEWKN